MGKRKQITVGTVVLIGAGAIAVYLLARGVGRGLAEGVGAGVRARVESGN